ncbi:hypothetical protein KKC67_01830 [Patescibacteria group bacterium]|nr:hypothetical protein [Patescibacteria group bacterium]MBU1062982.1 hypothetical protein [Patescibacteria group bacterium]MBU1991737.1 hypothetical protein [Patescibacteria group bacterium]
MINQQLLDYIKQQTQQGVSNEEIKNALTTSGWQAQDIEEAFSFILNPDSQPLQVPLSAPLPIQTTASLLSASAILGQAWNVCKKRFGVFLGIMVIPTLIMFGFLILLGGAGIMGIPLIYSEFATGGIALFIFLVILLFLIICISQAWGYVSLLYAIKDSQEGIGIIESYRRGWQKVASYWWISFLVGFIVLGGFFLFFVPGIIFSIWFSFAVFILIDENLKGMDALLKSKEYAKGNWGRIFWRFFFISIFCWLIYLVLTLIFGLVLGLVLGSFKFSINPEIVSYITQFLDQLLGLFLTPLIMTYLFLVYNNFKDIKGNVVFTPTKKSKTIFIAIGILGILIIPIISTLIMVSLNTTRQNARDVMQQSEIKQVQTGLEIYYVDNNSYPSSLDKLPNLLESSKSFQYQLQQNGTDYKLCTPLSMKKQECFTSKGTLKE